MKINQTKQTLVFHVGAHKTATTHLQNTLDKMQALFDSNQVKYLSREKSRKLFNKYYFMHKAKRTAYDCLPNVIKVKYLERLLGIKPNIRRHLFSEENILGGITCVFHKKIYSEFESRLTFLDILANKYDIEIYLSIRSFADIYPSGFITGLRYYPKIICTNKNALMGALSEGYLPSWYDFLVRLRERLPNASIAVWNYKFYCEKPLELFTEFCGFEVDELPAVPRPPNLSTPSVEGGKKLEGLVGHLDRVDAKKRLECDELINGFAPRDRNDKFTFLSDSQQEQLTKQYAKDIREIKSSEMNCHLLFL